LRPPLSQSWLRDLGLIKYEAAFDSNAITMDLLPTLTADDLKDLGVNVIGHRRRLLNAILSLRAAAEPIAGIGAAGPPPRGDHTVQARP